MEDNMKKICSGQLTKQAMVQQSLDQYRVVYSNVYARLDDVRQVSSF